jgi:hypothetical protein
MLSSSEGCEFCALLGFLCLFFSSSSQDLGKIQLMPRGGLVLCLNSLVIMLYPSMVVEC